VNQSAGQYIRSHEAVQRVSMRRQLHAFMQVSGDALVAALAPELMPSESNQKSPENGLSTGRPPAFAKHYRFIWPAEAIFIMQRMTGIY